MPTRRHFLTTSSLALAAIPFGALKRGWVPIPDNTARSLMGAMFFPEPMETATLRTLALAAIDAAVRAGASYADIRLSETPQIGVGLPVYDDRPNFIVNGYFSFGVRVIVNGAMACAYSEQPTIEAVVKVAKHATASARGLSGRLRHPHEIVPAPVVTGEWAVPMDIDPFTVPLQEQVDMLAASIAMARRVKYGDVVPPGVGYRWEHETQVLATSEGTMITQQFHRASIGFGVRGVVGDSVVDLAMDGPAPTMGGFEHALDPTLHDRIIRRTEDAVRLAAFPVKTLDVGRYDVVTRGNVTASLIAATVGPALELDRALGYEAGGPGISYLAPPLETLGQPVFSPLLTLTSDRALPALQGAKWDAEGVACTPVLLIDHGRVVDYLTSRTTAAALRSWYERQGKAIRSNGNASCGFDVRNPPTPTPGHLTVIPTVTRATVDDLCREITRGILVDSGGPDPAEEALSDTLLSSPLMFELNRGNVVNRLVQNCIPVRTKLLWTRALTRLGDMTTVENGEGFTKKSIWDSVSVAAPAASFKNLDVTQNG